MECGPAKVRRPIFWSPPPIGVSKLNVVGAARGKPGQAGIGGVLRNSKWEILFMFSKHVGLHDSNEAEVLAILEALWWFSRNFNGSLVVESDSSNAIAWLSNQKANPWKFHFLFNEIRTHVIFRHEYRWANSMDDVLIKQRVGLFPWEGFIL